METRTETRVRFIYKPPYDPDIHPQVYDYVYGMLSGSDPDRAAEDESLLEHCIVWIETRTVVETPWVAEEETRKITDVKLEVTWSDFKHTRLAGLARDMTKEEYLRELQLVVGPLFPSQQEWAWLSVNRPGKSETDLRDGQLD